MNHYYIFFASVDFPTVQTDCSLLVVCSEPRKWLCSFHIIGRRLCWSDQGLRLAHVLVERNHLTLFQPRINRHHETIIFTLDSGSTSPSFQNRQHRRIRAIANKECLVQRSRISLGQSIRDLSSPLRHQTLLCGFSYAEKREASRP